MKKYLDKLGGMIKKYVPNIKGENNAQHTQPMSYTIGKRKIKEEKLLSEGAFGYIWRATDVNSGEVFAVKRIICSNAQSLEAAKKQLEIMKKFKPSPYLVNYYGGDIIKESSNKTIVVILMELCPNGTLFDQLVEKQKTGFQESDLINIMKNIARGILAVHSAGYTHRDIKIQNVLIGKDDNYKLCDFGSCTDKIVDFSTITPKDYDEYTDEMEKNTTPMYRPPEIVDPFLKYTVGQKSDVWMLGCILYTLCYFIHPFLEATKIGISRAVFRIPSDSKHSDKINDLIRHLLTPNPIYRPSIESILDILHQWKAIRKIPLNEQAEKLKREQEVTDEQMGRYGKKTVSHEGDIPLEQLMKVQAKLTKKVEQEQIVTSFVKKKPAQKSPVIPEQTSVVPKPAPQAVQHPTVPTTGNTLWDFYSNSQSNTKPEKVVEKDFDFFSNFGSTPTEPIKNTTPTQSIKPSIVNQQHSTNIISNEDLLDYFDQAQQPAPQLTLKSTQNPQPIPPKGTTDLIDFL